ncbi:ATP-binding cassette domain-containing protein [Spirochaeta dissipatitropha]
MYTDVPAIETVGLVRDFGSTRAVAGVDIRVPQGAVYGLLGPNGAGKTTIVRMLATLLRPTAGTARVLGYDVVNDSLAIRRQVSLTGQFASLDEDLTCRENLLIIARLFGYSRYNANQRADELLAAFDLQDAANRQIKFCSGGMRRRADIAAGIIVRPALVFLDEPTTGLDPRGRNSVWEIVRAMTSEGTTVLLTTQYLDEADQLADRIAVIDQGRIIAEGTSGELKSSVGSGRLHIRVTKPEHRQAAAALLQRCIHVEPHYEADPFAVSALVSDMDTAARVLHEIKQSGIDVSNFSFGRPSLDEVFLTLTGHAIGKPTGEAHENE